MARQQNNSDAAEVVIFFARVRGGGSVVAESVEKLAHAVDRASQPRLPARPPAKLIANDAKPSEPSLFDPIEQAEDVVADAAAPPLNEVPAESATRTPRGQGPKTDRNAGIVAVGDVDFVPAGKPPLKTFFVDKAPTTDMERTLVICHWLEHTLAVPSVTPGHLLSGLRHVGQPIPKDLQQTIRNAAKNKTWFDATDIHKIRTTTVGQNVVEHELPKKK